MSDRSGSRTTADGGVLPPAPGAAGSILTPRDRIRGSRGSLGSCAEDRGFGNRRLVRSRRRRLPTNPGRGPSETREVICRLGPRGTTRGTKLSVAERTQLNSERPSELRSPRFGLRTRYRTQEVAGSSPASSISTKALLRWGFRHRSETLASQRVVPQEVPNDPEQTPPRPTRAPALTERSPRR
jgi:hypothetical protein